jgi:hypothetical protein
MLGLLACASVSWAAPIDCDLRQYKPGIGPSAAVQGDALVVTWTGDAGSDLRMSLALDNGQPLMRELAVRARGGQWAALGRNLVPEYEVTSGLRRISSQQLAPLVKELGMKITPELVEREKWQVFWDAPLLVPGTAPRVRPTAPGEAADRNPGLPRKPEEIRRAKASFHAQSCTVKTDGRRLEITFPGLTMGIFAGDLRFTAYRGTSLVRMEAVAKTDEPSVAYKYDGGLKGFSTQLTPRVTWNDTGGDPQQYRFGGVRNEGRVGVRARNRILIAEGRNASIATFPAPHTFFFAREIEANLGYVFYRKDSDTQFSIGVRQPEHEQDGEYEQNFALYNAPPGTWQRMAVYFYLSPSRSEPTRRAVLRFTHDDRFKPVSGYKVMTNHVHTRFTEQVRKDGSLDGFTQDLAAFKAMGINIVGLSDFHDDLHQFDPGPFRFPDQHDYFAAAAKASDKDFLVLPGEESFVFGGHYNVLFPHPVYWSIVRLPNQPFMEEIAPFGRVYHADKPEDFQRLLEAENGYWFYAHQRTKGSTGYPDATLDKWFVRNDRNIGASFKPGMGADLSDLRLCEWRCFDALDTMNNHIVNSGLQPKYLVADIDTYRKAPEDDLYPQFPVSYVKVAALPGPTEDWSPVLKALREGNSFVTTGEILFKNYAVEGAGNNRNIAADLEWTFPLEFLEIVWGDGKSIDRQVIRVTELPPFGSRHFSFPFDATGRSWVRFAAWDSAGDGAFVQPVWLQKTQ